MNDENMMPADAAKTTGKKHWLARAIEGLDRFSRDLDFAWNRTANRPWLTAIARITPSLMIPFWIVVVTVVAGPLGDGWTRISQGIAISLAVIAVVGGAHWAGKRVDVDAMVQAGLVLVLCGVVTALGWNEPARHGHIYLHSFVLLAALLSLSILVGAWFAPRSVDSELLTAFSSSLKTTELVAPEVDVNVSWTDIVRGFFITPFRSPFQLAVPPAIAVLFARPGHVETVFLIAVAVTWMMLTFGNVHDRLDAMINVLRPLFLRGGALLVTLLLFVLAGARLAGIDYVTTVLDSAAAWNIFALLVSTYAFCWWADAWQGRIFAARLLAGFGKVEGGCFVEYDFDNAKRTLAAHGAARFCVLREQRFHTYDVMAFVRALRRDDQALASFRRSAGIYALATNAIVVLGFVATGLIFNKGPQNAQLEATTRASGVDLVRLLEEKCATNETAIVIASSGGGTRAALHTASVLYALDERGKADDVILASGVSGGGAALAWFAANRAALFAKDTHDAAWNQYFEDMSYPYINDVLKGAFEGRILAGLRLGALLKESFEARWPKKNDKPVLVHDVDALGLFFNTAIAGRFDRPQAPRVQQTRQDQQRAQEVEEEASMALDIVEWRHRDETRSTLAGGRLVLTNLALPSHFPTQGLGVDGSIKLFTQLVRAEQTTLANAAALNANFPPVFSNAAVDLDEQTRFWVTDGGATDNRGMEMPLFALRQALSETTCRPRIRFVVADASAFSAGFSQDRGLGSIMGGGAMFASQLAVELVDDIEALYGEKADDFSFHYIAMPAALRGGSLGTHWMLQPRVRVKNPCHEDDRCPGDPMRDQPPSVLLDDKRELIWLIRYLRRADAKPEERHEDTQLARDWCLSEQIPTTEWVRLVNNL